MWEHCVAAMEAGRLDPRLLAAFGRFLLLWNELTSLAVTDGYRAAERDILARIGGGPPGCAPGAPRRRPGRCGDRSPPATHGRAARPGPRSGLLPRRHRATARERSHPRAAGHRRGGAGGPRRTDRPPARCDRPGCRGRRGRDPAAGRPPAPRTHRDPRPRRLGRPEPRAEGARHRAGRPRGGCDRPGPEGHAAPHGDQPARVGGRLRTGRRRRRLARRHLCRSRRCHAHRAAARPAWLDPGS